MAQSAKRLAELLKARQLTIAVAETSAGGLVASKLLARPGASGFFRGGIVCYSAQAKRALLPGLPEKLAPTATEKHALQLAVALRELLEVDYAIGESGVAGPSKNSRGIAPGVDAVAVAGPDGVYLTRMLFPDTELSAADAYGQAPKVPRADAMEKFSESALALAVEALEAT